MSRRRYGYTTLFINGGEFTNQGIELSLTGDAGAAPQRLHLGHHDVVLPELQRRERAAEPPFVAANAFGFGADYLAPGRSLTDIMDPNFTQANGLNPQVGDFAPGDSYPSATSSRGTAFRLSASRSGRRRQRRQPDGPVLRQRPPARCRFLGFGQRSTPAS